MKSVRLVHIAAAFASFFGIENEMRAAPVYWDVDGAVPGAGGGGQPTATWNAGNTLWNSDPGGTAVPAAWVANDVAVFAAGTDATGAYEVTISGTQVISGLTFEEGSVTLSGGILDIGTAVGGLADFNVMAGASANISSVIQGNPGGTTVFRKIGTGVLTLSGTNTFGGTGKRIAITEGVLSFSANANLGNSANVIDLGTATTTATLRYTGNTAAVARGIVLAGPAASSVGNIFDITTAGQVLTISTAMSGGPGNSTQAAPGTNVAFTVRGAGALDLSGTNTFTGDIVVDGGTYNVNSLTDWGGATVANSTSHTITMINGGKLAITATSAVNPTASTLTSYNLVQIGSGGGTIDVVSGGTLQLDDAGQFFGSGNLTKTGLGTLLLANAFTGYTGTQVNHNGGILQLQTQTALGTAGAQAAIIMAGGSTLNLRQNTSTNFGSAITLTGNATIAPGRTSAGGAVTQTVGGLTMGTHTLTVSLGSSFNAGTAGSLVFNGPTVLTGNPTFNTTNVQGAGIGTTTIGAINDGGVARTITKTGNGTLILAADPTSFTAGSQVDILQGTLQLNTLTALAGANISFGDTTLGNSNSAGFVFSTTGTSTLNLTLNAGTSGMLTIGGVNTTGTLNMSGVYTINNTNVGLTAATGGTVAFTNSLTDGGVARTFNKLGGGTVVLSVANTIGATSAINIANGTLQASVPGSLGTGAVPISVGGASGRLQLGNGLVVDGDVTYTSGWNTAGTGPIAVVSGATATINGDIFINDIAAAGGHLDGGGGLTINGAIVTGGTSGGLVSLRTGTVLLNNAVGNSYSTFAVSAGTVNLGVANAIVTTATLNFTVASTGTVNLQGNNQTVAAITYTGTGTSNGIINTGAGVLTVNGNISATTAGGSHTINGNLSLGGILRDVTVGTGPTLTIAANVLDGGIFKKGAGVLVLSGTGSTYTDVIAVGEGTLRITSESNLGSNPLAFDAARLTLSGGTLEANATFTIDDANRGITVGDGAAGSGTFDVNSGFTLTVANGIAGTGRLIKADVGTLVLSAANTYTGGTLISAGRVQIASDDNLGAVPLVATAGSLILNGGTLAATENLEIHAFRGIALGPDAAAGTGTMEVAPGKTVIYNGVMADNGSGTGGLTKTGNGVLRLGGQNTYTGPTAISAGTLQLNFNAATAPASNIIAGTSALSMGGGTLLVSGKDGQASTQTFAGLSLTAGASTIQVVQGTGVGSSATLNLGSTYARTAGTSVNFILPTTGSITLAASNLNGAGLLAGAVVNGSSFATINGSNEIVAASLTYLNKNDLTTWVANDNISNTADYFNSLTANLDINALRFNFNGAADADLGAGRILGVISGIEVTGSVGGFTSAIANGTVRGSVGGELTILQNNTLGDLVISSVVANNTTATAFVKWGLGRVTLSGANSYTGATYVNMGTLRTGNATALGTGAAGVFIASGATLELGGFNLSGKAISVSGEGVGGAGAIRATSGVSVINTLVTLNGTTRVSADSGARVNFDAASGNAMTGVNQNLIVSGAGIVIFADPLALGTATLTKEGTGTLGASTFDTSLGGPSVVLNLNGGRISTGGTGSRNYTNTQININANMAFGDTTAGHTGIVGFGVAAVNLGGVTRTLDIDEETTFGGVISNGSIIKAGDDILNITNGGNTFTDFTHTNSTVRVGADNALGTGTLTFSTNGGIDLMSTDTVTRIFDNAQVNVGVSVDFGDATRTGGLIFNGLVDLLGGVRTLNVNNPAGTGAVVFKNVVSNGSVTKGGAGALVFEASNTYTGATLINTGSVVLRGANSKLVSTVITIGDNSGNGESLTVGENTEVTGTGLALDHLGDTTQVELRGGVTFTYNGPNNGAVASIENTEIIGILDPREGTSTILLNPASGATMQLTASDLHRTDAVPGAAAHATLIIRGTGLGGTGANTSRLVITNAPAALGLGGTGASASIIPWIIGGTSATAAADNFVRYDAVNGFTPLDPVNDYVSDFSVANLGKNFSLAGGGTLSNMYAANALKIAGGTTTLSGVMGRLSLGNSVLPGGVAFNGAGALLFTGTDGTIAGTGRLNFGTQRGHLWVSSDTSMVGSISASLSGTGGFIASTGGSGTNILSLDGDNVFTGGIIVNSGILRVGHAGALNDNYFNAVVLRTGGGGTIPTLRVNGFNTSMLVTGSDFLEGGSIMENESATNATLTFVSTADSSGNTGVIRDGAGGGTLSIVKRGANFLQLDSNQTYTGSTTILQGMLQMSGNSTGRLTQTSAINIMSGGRFRLISSSTSNVDSARIPDGAPINMHGGTFEYDHGTGFNTSENAGPLNILAGYNIVTNDSAGSSNTSNLQFDSLSRPNMGAVVDFQGGSLGTGDLNRISFDLTPPALNGGIIGGWAFWSGTINTPGTDFATYGPAGASTNNSVKVFAGYDTAIVTTAWTTDTNSAATASLTLDGNRTVNSLKLADAINLNLNGFALNVDTGGIIALGANAKLISNGTITAGTLANTDLILNNASGNTTEISAQIVNNSTGAVGFTKVGAGTVLLSNAGNSHTGATAILGGTLSFTADSNLGAAPGAGTAGHLRIFGGTLNLAATSGTVVLNSNRGIEIGGASSGTTGTAANVIQSTAGANLVYNGSITSVGNASLTLNGDVDMALSASSTIEALFQVTGTAAAGSGGANVAFGGLENKVGNSLNIGRDGNGQASVTYGVTDGSLAVGYNHPNASNLDVALRSTTATTATSGTLNLAGSASFTASVDRFRIGTVITATSGTGDVVGSVTLAASNYIFAGTEILLGDSTVTTAATPPTTPLFAKGTLRLGATNTFVTPLMTVGGRRGVADLDGGSFVDFISGGTLTLYGPGGTTDLRIAHNNVSTASSSSGTMNLSGGVFMADLGTLTIGLKGTTGDSSTGGAFGALILGSGANQVTANSVILGQMINASGTIVPDTIAQGALFMAGGTFTVAGDVSLGLWQDNTGTDGAAQGTLVITGGAFTIGGNVVKAATTRSSATVEVNGATAVLDMTGGTIGASQLIFRNGSLVNVVDATLDGAGVGGGTTFAALDDALVLRDVSVGFAVNLTNATANKGGIRYEAASGGSGATITSQVDLGNIARTITVEESAGAAVDLHISGNVVNGTSLTKAGLGTLVLGGTNSYSGSTTVSAGTLRAGSSSAFGNTASQMSVSTGATLQLGGHSITVGSLAGGGSVQNAAAAGSVLTFGGDNTPTSTFTGNVSDGIGGGALSLTKVGTGIQILSGTNSHTGATVVSEGTLRAGLTATSSISVSGIGSLELRDNLGVALTLAGTPGVLTLADGAHLGFELGNLSNYDRITISPGGTAIVSGSITLDFFGLSGFGAGTYNLISASGGGLNAGTYLLGSAPSGFNYTINKTDTLVQLLIEALTARYWTFTGSGAQSWNIANRWSDTPDGLTPSGMVPATGDTVIFSATNTSTAAPVTTLDAAFIIDSLQFIAAPTGVTAVTINPGTDGSLTISPTSASNGITVLANAGNISIAAPLTAGGAQTWSVDATGASLSISGPVNFANRVTKIGSGVLTLSGANSGSGGLTLSVGTLNLNSATALGTGLFTIGLNTTLNNTTAGALVLTTNNSQF